MEKLIIEAALNELQDKADNPNVPYGPREVAQAAAACVEAGAAMLHFHARDAATGEQLWTSHETYAEAMRHIYELGVPRDILFYPTYKGLTEASLAHMVALSRDQDVRLPLAALDVGAVLLNRYDPEAKRFANPETAKAFSHQEMVWFFELCRRQGVRPYNGCAEPGHIRHILTYLDMGLVDEPVLFKFFTSEYAPFGMPTTPRGVQMYADIIAELAPGLRHQWFIHCYGPSILPMATQAIVLGGHVRIGLGDETFRDAGRPTNAELVGRIAQIARAAGREIATPREARAIMALPQYEEWPEEGRGK